MTSRGLVAADIRQPEGFNAMSIADAKQMCRRRVEDRLDRLSPARREAAGRAVAERLTALPAVADAGCVMAFLSMPTEIDTWPTIRWAWSRDIRVLVPRVEPPMTLERLAVHERDIVPVWLEPSDAEVARRHPEVQPGAFGILEVAGDPVAADEIDVVLAPCQAVDRQGKRLGKGGGFYDRFLARDDVRAAVIAVAYEEQLLDSVPAGPRDRAVDAVVTDERTLWFG